jgi:sugar lactone lactonase YvrE
LAALEKSSNNAIVQPAAGQKATKRRGATGKQALEMRRTMYTGQKDQYAQIKKQYAEMMGQQPKGELTDAEIDQQVKASKAYKMQASSISAMDNDVFLATHATYGYGFEVWRMDENFENPTKIVKDLSGCCGQMDVKASKDGIFVAENSRHRVCRFDREGKSLASWGEQARTGLAGFGSCCNPMNVAFGPDNAVYTAEDDTGRIKRYSPEGKLLGLVGAVELKPGCKNCAISVSGDGNQVYMLDITRNFIVRLDARPADEVAADAAKAPSAPRAETPDSGTGASLLIDGLRLLLTSGN